MFKDCSVAISLGTRHSCCCQRVTEHITFFVFGYVLTGSSLKEDFMYMAFKTLQAPPSLARPDSCSFSPSNSKSYFYQPKPHSRPQARIIIIHRSRLVNRPSKKVNSQLLILFHVKRFNFLHQSLTI